MKFLYKIILLLVLFIVTRVEAQQDTNYSLYRYNMNLLNPAYAGSDGTIDFGINTRSQWSNIEGAPQTQSFIFGMPVGGNVGLGLSVISDKTFIEKQTAIAADFSYHLKLNDIYDLYFGVKAGFNSYNANTAGLVTYGIEQDPKLVNLNSRLNPNIGAGLYLKHEDYFFAFSVPKIINTDRLEENNGITTAGAGKVHMYLSGGYDFVLNAMTKLSPSVLICYVNAAPLSVDLTAVLEFNNHFDLGAAYRVNEAVSGLVIFKTSSNMQIGYAYETSVEGSVRQINRGTHEIIMKLKI